MAEMGVEAVKQFADDGTKPGPGDKGFIDTGVTLITDEPQEGVESEDTTVGLENCWG
jgi:fructose transport system substrate-binding protein